MDIVWEDIIKLLVTAVIATLIGIDREKRHKPAGIRTNMIVGIISCLIMIVSLKIGNSNTGILNNADPARLAAQVISGIGFLGAGTILKNEDKVEGLTTAAGLWAVAGLGLAIGYGLYILSIAAAIIIFVSLLLNDKRFF
ncbi:MAG TPA: MgtC/SapB family protein [Halanaerobiales bacterium]|nr:MgtC/SapB family protein [Halanaerobiales bacterium]